MNTLPVRARVKQVQPCGASPRAVFMIATNEDLRRRAKQVFGRDEKLGIPALCAEAERPSTRVASGAFDLAIQVVPTWITRSGRLAAAPSAIALNFQSSSQF